MKEIPSLRTKFSDTYQTASGVYNAKVFAGPVNYQASDGSWQPIDDQLVPSGSEFVNKADSYRAQLPSSLGSAPVHLSSGDDSVSMRLEGATASATASVNGHSATYHRVLPGVDATYQTETGAVKESLTLADASAGSPITFHLQLSSGLRAVEHDGAILLQNAKGKTVIGMPKPFMLDANAASDHPKFPSDFGPVAVSVKRVAGGIDVTYTPDHSWLTAAGRAFPVRLDPSYVWPSETADCDIFQSAPNTSYCSVAPYDYVGFDGNGYLARTMMNFQGVQGALPNDSQVLGARVYMQVDASTSNDPFIVVGMTRQFTSLATWNTYDGQNSWTSPGGDTDGAWQTTGSAPYDWGGSPEQVSFNVTALTQSWVDQSRSVPSLFITPENAVAGQYFAIQNGASGSSYPYMEIAYQPRIGSPQGATVQTTQLSDRMSLGVNVANGDLMVNNNDLNIAGNGLNSTVNRVDNNLSSDEGAFGWSVTNLPTLQQITNDAVYVTAPDGNAMVFDSDPSFPGYHFIATAGIDATLCFGQLHPSNSCPGLIEGANYQLTFRSGERWEFDSAGKLLADIDQNGDQISYAYNGPNGSLSQVTDTHGRAVSYSYGSNGLVSGISDNTGGRSLSYTYNASGQLSGYQDAAGKTTTYTYGDAQQDLTQITDPAGEVTNLSYDSSYRVTSITRVTNNSNGTGDTTTYSYGPPSNCGADPDGGHAYGETTETDANGHQTIYCYDTHDRVFQKIDAYGYRTTIGHDLDDKVTSQTQPLSGQYTGGTTTTCYDTSPSECNNPADQNGCERPTAQIAPLALSTSQSPATALAGYPASCSAYSPPTDFEPSSGTDPQGNTISYAYDSNGNLSQVTNQLASQNTITIHRNLSNQCSSGTCYSLVDYTVSPDGARTNYGYDGSGNLTSISPPSPLGQISNGYDALSRRTSTTDGNGKATSVQYDAMDRIVKQTYADGATTTNTYDPDGNLTQQVDSQTGTSTFTYDLKNRLTSENSPNVNNAYGYDGADNLTSVSDAGGTVTYGFDHDNRLTSVQEPGASTAIGFTYDVDGRRICATYPNGTAVQTLYDTSGNILSIKAANGSGASCNPNSQSGTPNGSVFTSYAYTYNVGGADTGLRQAMQVNNTTPYSYYYDALNRLLEATGGGLAQPLYYTYDGDGNLLSKTDANGSVSHFTYNSADENSSASYSYDAAGNLISRPDSSGTTSLGYNPRNQTSSINPDGSGAQTLAYLGNGQNRPTQIGNVPFLGSAPPMLENNVLGISSQAAAVPFLGSPSITYYTRDTQGSLLGERTPSGHYYYVEDANGSVVALTDQNGNVANTYTYDPWGKTISSTGTAPNSFGFDEGFQSQGGLYHFGQRYYDPAAGSWTQEDPVAHLTDPTQRDAYTFSGDDPINATDSSGTASRSECIWDCLERFAGGWAVRCAHTCLGCISGSPHISIWIAHCALCLACLIRAGYKVKDLRKCIAGCLSSGKGPEPPDEPNIEWNLWWDANWDIKNEPARCQPSA